MDRERGRPDGRKEGHVRQKRWKRKGEGSILMAGDRPPCYCAAHAE